MERSIKEDLEAAGSSKRDQEQHKNDQEQYRSDQEQNVTNMERSGAIKSQIERPIKEDLEAAAPIRSDQEHKGAIRGKMERTLSDQERSSAKSSAPSKKIWKLLLP